MALKGYVSWLDHDLSWSMSSGFPQQQLYHGQQDEAERISFIVIEGIGRSFVSGSLVDCEEYPHAGALPMPVLLGMGWGICIAPPNGEAEWMAAEGIRLRRVYKERALRATGNETVESCHEEKRMTESWHKTGDFLQGGRLWFSAGALDRGIVDRITRRQPPTRAVSANYTARIMVNSLGVFHRAASICNQDLPRSCQCREVIL